MTLATIEKLNEEIAELKGDIHQMKEFLFAPFVSQEIMGLDLNLN